MTIRLKKTAHYYNIYEYSFDIHIKSKWDLNSNFILFKIDKYKDLFTYDDIMQRINKNHYPLILNALNRKAVKGVIKN